MQLHRIEAHGCDDAPDLGGVGAGEHAHFQHASRHRRRDGAGLCPVEGPRRPRHEVEPDRVGPRFSDKPRVVGICDAADFDVKQHGGGEARRTGFSLSSMTGACGSD